MTDQTDGGDRRRFLRTIGAVGLGGALAGCAGGGGGGGGGDDTATDTESGGDTATDTATEASGGGGGDDGGDAFTVGVAWPYSGDLSVFGPRDERGMKLALEDINSATIRGRELNTVVEDTQTSAQTGVSAAQKLVNQDGVPVVVGACSSGVSVAIAESVTIPNGVVQMIPNSTSPAITRLDDDGYVMRTAVSDALQGTALAQVASDAGVSSAAIVLVNNDYGTGFANAMEEAFTAAGGEITGRVTYESGKSSYRPQLNRAMEGDPEALVFIAYPQSFTTMAKQAFEMGIKDQVQYVAGESVVADATEQNIPAEAIDGMIGTNPSPPVESDTYQSFATSFQDAYDRTPTVWAAYTYDAFNLVALAIQRADEFTSEAIRDNVYAVSRPDGTEVSSFSTGKAELEAGNEVNYQGVSGTVDLNDAGDVPGTYRRWTVEDGAFRMGEFIEVTA